MKLKNTKKIILLLTLIILFLAISAKIKIDRPFEIHKYEDDGIETKYIEYGVGNEITIFFLHGAGLRSSTYTKNFELLAGDYHIIAPNIPLFGGATIPEEVWDLRDFAIFFENFLKEKEMENIIAIGHSFGGGITANLANISDRIDYVILVDAAGGLALPDKGWDDAMDAIIDGFIDGMERNFAMTLIVTGDFTLGLPNLISSPLHAEEIIQVSVNNIYDYSRIKVPVTILWGGRDDEGGLDETAAEYFHTVIRGSELEYVGGGHSWPIFEPKKFAEIVDEKIKTFLKTN